MAYDFSNSKVFGVIDVAETINSDRAITYGFHLLQIGCSPTEIVVRYFNGERGAFKSGFQLLFNTLYIVIESREHVSSGVFPRPVQMNSYSGYEEVKYGIERSAWECVEGSLPNQLFKILYPDC